MSVIAGARDDNSAWLNGFRRGVALRSTRVGSWYLVENSEHGVGGVLVIDRRGDATDLVPLTQRLRELDIPGVAPVRDLVGGPRQCWLIIASAPGPTVADLCRAGDGDADSAVALAMDTGSALLQLHHRGLAHGNIGPESVIVNARGSAELLDWVGRGSAHTAADDVREWAELVWGLARQWCVRDFSLGVGLARVAEMAVGDGGLSKARDELDQLAVWPPRQWLAESSQLWLATHTERLSEPGARLPTARRPMTPVAEEPVAEEPVAEEPVAEGSAEEPDSDAAPGPHHDAAQNYQDPLDAMDTDALPAAVGGVEGAAAAGSGGAGRDADGSADGADDDPLDAVDTDALPTAGGGAERGEGGVGSGAGPAGGAGQDPLDAVDTDALPTAGASGADRPDQPPEGAADSVGPEPSYAQLCRRDETDLARVTARLHAREGRRERRRRVLMWALVLFAVLAAGMVLVHVPVRSDAHGQPPPWVPASQVIRP